MKMDFSKVSNLAALQLLSSCPTMQGTSLAYDFSSNSTYLIKEGSSEFRLTSMEAPARLLYAFYGQMLKELQESNAMDSYNNASEFHTFVNFLRTSRENACSADNINKTFVSGLFLTERALPKVSELDCRSYDIPCLNGIISPTGFAPYTTERKTFPAFLLPHKFISDATVSDATLGQITEIFMSGKEGLEEFRNFLCNALLRNPYESRVLNIYGKNAYAFQALLTFVLIMLGNLAISSVEQKPFSHVKLTNEQEVRSTVAGPAILVARMEDIDFTRALLKRPTVLGYCQSEAPIRLSRARRIIWSGKPLNTSEDKFVASYVSKLALSETFSPYDDFAATIQKEGSTILKWMFHDKFGGDINA